MAESILARRTTSWGRKRDGADGRGAVEGRASVHKALSAKRNPEITNVMHLAGKEGFEPSVLEYQYAGFRIRCIRPLCHLPGVAPQNRTPIGLSTRT